MFSSWSTNSPIYQTVYAASLNAKQHAFNQNGLGALISASSPFFSNRNYSKSIISSGSNGSTTSDTTNNNRNIPKNLSNGGSGDKYIGSGKQGGGSGKDGLPCPKCGHPKCVNVDLAGKGGSMEHTTKLHTITQFAINNRLISEIVSFSKPSSIHPIRPVR